MNKLFLRIATAFAGMAMAIGVGVAIGANQDVNVAKASEVPGETKTLEITRSNFGDVSGTYSICEFSSETSGGTSITGYADIYRNTTASMQFSPTAGSKIGAIWNTVAIPGYITSVSAKTASGTNRAWKAYLSNTAYSYSESTLNEGTDAFQIGSNTTITTDQTTIFSSSTHGCSFFCLIAAAGASYIDNFTITYVVSDSYSGTPVTDTYTFTNKSWNATLNESAANWTSGKDGNSFTANQGVAITSGVSGANATSPSSYTDVKKIVVRYCTNASSGVGTVKVKVGTNEEVSFAYTTKTGGTTLRDATFAFPVKQSGSVKITVDCSTNSLYIYSVAITCDSGVSIPTLAVSVNSLLIGVGSTNTFTVTATDLTNTFSVSSGNTGKVTIASISPEASKNDGDYVVTLNGVATTTSAVTVTVSSVGAESKTVSVEVVTPSQKMTNALKNGTYIIADATNSAAMNNTDAGSTRLGKTAVSIKNNAILNSNSAIFWKVRKTSNGYYTFYNSAINKYCHATGTASQVEVSDSPESDGELWTVTETSADSGLYNVVSKRNTDAVVNAYLRNSTSYFACYASGTGHALSFYGAVEDSLTLSKTSSSFDDDETDTVTLGVVNNTAAATYQATSNDTGVCTVGISGTTLTITGVAAGTTTIDVVLKIGGVATDWGTIDVEVNSTESVKSISIKADGVDKTGATVSLMQGASLELSYVATNNNDLPWTGAVTYSLSGTTYATIDGNVVTASTSTTGGPTTVTVRVDSDPSKTASFTLNVTAWSGVLTINSYYVLSNMADNDFPSELTGVYGTGTGAANIGFATQHTTYISTLYPLKVVAGNTYNSYAFMTNEVDGEDHPYYLCHDGNNNTLSKTTTLDNKASWTVSVSNGEYTITNVADSRIIRYNPNLDHGVPNNPRFAAYESGQSAVRLIEIDNTVKVQGFVEAYMHTEIPTSTRTDTGACYGTDGTDGYFAAAKDALDSSFYSPIADTFATSATYADYWERYVAWGARCEVVVTYSGGIQYNAVTVPHTQVFEDANNSSMLTIVAIVSTFSLLAVGGYFFLRRKQH